MPNCLEMPTLLWTLGPPGLCAAVPCQPCSHNSTHHASVSQNCRQALCHKATILGWSRLKAVFAEKDVWTILRALVSPSLLTWPGGCGHSSLVVFLLLLGFGRTWHLFSQLEKEAGKALWFLKQCVSLFKSPQAPIRQAAVWFAGTAFPWSHCVLILSSAWGPRF